MAGAAPASSTLADAIAGLDAGARDARLWMDEVRATSISVADQSDSLVEAARRARLAARRLANAATRNNCVGVFGPSQAGKSYLVSALARPRGQKLSILFGGERRDFLTEINPPGDRESTGLVTRFTIHQRDVDAAHPVQLRLLTETDLIKILANSFFLDFDPNNLTVEPVEEPTIREAVKTAAAAAQEGQGGAAHLDEIALFDLTEYFHKNFGSRVGALNRADYWEGLVAHGGRLALRDRAALFSLLWGRLDNFTQLYVTLVEALDRIGHAPEAHAAIASLIPREKDSRPNSVIDVAVLARLGTQEDAADAIPLVPIVAGRPGAPTSLQRATLTALIAEVSLVIAAKAWDFFEHTDLLDFPGARSRLKLTNLPGEPEERGRQVRELFLRGKIAYLFQRYTDELELTSMLLCMPPSVAEVKDLAGMVRSWIAATHGATPDRRRAVRNALFLVLTKHDLEFLEKGGETAESRTGKWDRRLHASLLELYGKDGWPGDWDGRPFDNTVFLRNPGMKQVYLMEYADEAALVESGPAKGSAALVAEYKAAFLGSALVAKHFARKEEVWEAAMTPNDGGVAFLVGRLNEVLDPNLKHRQAAVRLVEAASALEQPLRAFYFADSDAARKERDEAVQKLRRELNARLRVSEFRSFAHLLRGLMVREEDVRGLFHNVAALREDQLADAEEAAGASAEAATPFDDDPWAEPAEPAAAAAPLRVVRRKDRPEVFASRVLNLWAAHLRAFQQNATALTVLGIPAELVGRIVDELLVGASRAELSDQIADDVRRETVSVGARWTDAADRVVRIAAQQVNDFVAYLGYGGLPPAERPGFPEPPKERTRPVFALTSLRRGEGELGDAREPIEVAFFVDWGVALRAFVGDNSGHTAGREISENQNRRLGAILTVVDPARLMAAAAGAG
jgi:hypothetical protein